MAENKPAHKWADNKEYIIRFLFDEPKRGSTDGRDWWMYTAEVDGEERQFFATYTLHSEINNAECKKGTTYYITKSMAGGRFVAWLVLKNPQSTENYAMGKSGTAPPPPKEYESEDDKWDKINRKKRLEIAHGQAFNIATMTINGAKPTLYFDDKPRWVNAVISVVETIRPYLVEEQSELKKEGHPDGSEHPPEEEDDGLPF